MADATVKTFMLEDDGSIPNNPDLPLLVYRGALPDTSAETCRRLFKRNGWTGTWVNGVFSYHHYHSNAHEALGVVSGSARIQFGGPQGVTLDVEAGDAVILPAGTGHCNKGGSGDFRVVGAYPPGQASYDLKRGDADERPEALDNIRSTPLPERDPVFGADGPLPAHWG